MINPNIKIEKKETKSYPALPENIYQVQLLDITSKEEEEYNSKKDKTIPAIMETILSFQYTLLNGTDSKQEKEEDKSLRGRNVWHNYVPTYLYIGKNGKNNLYKIVEALLGKELTQEEEAFGIDGKFLNELIGKQCRVGIKHKPSKDGSKVYDNIESYYAIENEATPLSDEEKDKARVKDKDEKKAEEVKDTSPEITDEDLN